MFRYANHSQGQLKTSQSQSVPLKFWECILTIAIRGTGIMSWLCVLDMFVICGFATEVLVDNGPKRSQLPYCCVHSVDPVLFVMCSELRLFKSSTASEADGSLIFAVPTFPFCRLLLPSDTLCVSHIYHTYVLSLIYKSLSSIDNVISTA